MNECDIIGICCVFFRPQSWNRNSQLLLDAQDNSLHFVILGSGQLADQLAREIRVS